MHKIYKSNARSDRITSPACLVNNAKRLVAWRNHVLGASAALFALLPSNPTKAAEPVIIHILDYGTYDVANCAKQQFTDEGGDWYGCDDTQHLATSRTIVAGLRTRFGFRFSVHLREIPSQISLRVNLKFPAPGVSLTGSSKPTERDSYADNLQASPDGDAIDWVIWNFGLTSHLVPGIWTFEVWDGDHKLTEQKFNVVLPPNS